jgi:DnaJ-class molecular chaperone
MNYYGDLNVLPTATMEDIKTKFNNIENKQVHHLKAYATLSDYNSRRKYDNLMEENIEIKNNEVADNFASNDHIDNSFKEDNDNSIFSDNLNYSSDNNDLLNILNKYFSEINIRLENIEKRIYQNNKINNNFYKEKQNIKTKVIDGKKVTKIITETNINGKRKQKEKTISYDSNGNAEINYKYKNI